METTRAFVRTREEAQELQQTKNKVCEGCCHLERKGPHYYCDHPRHADRKPDEAVHLQNGSPVTKPTNCPGKGIVVLNPQPPRKETNEL